MKIKLSIMFIFLAVTFLRSTHPWAAAAAPSRAPVLRAQLDGKSHPMILANLDVDVKIHGVIAETKMTMTFFNPHNRRLEGELYFPLPEGSTVSGYALDIAGVMVDGVVVEKEKGRVVFEKIVRQGIDPGLVEWVKGNNFKTRIYPIPAKGSRTVSVRYVSKTGYRDRVSFFHLPIRFNQTVDNFSLRVEVVNGLIKPEIKKGGPANFSFSRWHDSFVAETELKNPSLDRDLIIQFPAPPNQSGQPVQVELSPGGNYYFCIRDLDTGWPGPTVQKQKIPRHISIYWDASGSMGHNDRLRELELLRAYFARLGNDKIRVQLIFFRHRPSSPKVFTIAGGNAEVLLREIKAAVYDGGTSIGALSLRPGSNIPDCYFLFTDGNSNFGAEDPRGFKAPVYVFSNSATANHPFLRYLARKTGGRYLNLVRLENQEVLQALGKSPYSFISAVYPPGAIAETFPRDPGPVDERFTLAGKLLAEKAQITLNYGIKGKILKQTSFVVSRVAAHRGRLLRTFWAQEKITALMIFQKNNRKELLQTGKQYGLVTPGTSLIVLDNLRQYLEHEIEPPLTLPELRKEYLKQQAEKKKQSTKMKEDKLAEVITLWKKRVAWWNRSFTIPRSLPVKKKRAGITGADMPSPDESEEVESISTGAAEGVIGGVDGGVEGGVVGGVLGAPAISGAPAARRMIAPVEIPGEIGAPRKNGAEVRKKQFSAPVISLKPWEPSAPYLGKIKSAEPVQAFSRYLEQKKDYGNSPSFYLDCADYFFQRKRTAAGLQILSNIAELELENVQLLRVLGHQLCRWGFPDLSVRIFERVLELKPEEPQSYRDLALVLARQKKFLPALKLLYHVITTRWDRFPEVEIIALMELNNFLARAKEKGTGTFAVDPRLVKLLDVDLRIVLTWDADLTDMDLWVIDPRGEKSFYGNKCSAVGGLMSCDFTRGYGPEEYVLKKAVKGTYKIKVNYFGNSAQKLIGPVTLQVDIFTNYGRKNQQKKSITLRLKEAREVISAGTIEF